MTALAPTSGELRGKFHVFPVRVYYEDTDAGGIVYHANYLRFAERARTEMLRIIGIEQSKLAGEVGLMFAVYKGDVHYAKPARLDDTLMVETSLTGLGAASLKIRQVISRAADELVRFNAEVASLDRTRKPARLPEHLKKTLMTYVTA